MESCGNYEFQPKPCQNGDSNFFSPRSRWRSKIDIWTPPAAFIFATINMWRRPKTHSDSNFFHRPPCCIALTDAIGNACTPHAIVDSHQKQGGSKQVVIPTFFHGAACCDTTFSYRFLRLRRAAAKFDFWPFENLFRLLCTIFDSSMPWKASKLKGR